MNRIQTSPTHVVIAVNNSQDPRNQELTSGPSEELIEISKRLKEALEGLSAWVQIHALLQREGEDLSIAAKDLARIDSIFQSAHDELISYNQQIPEPFDGPLAYEMVQTIEVCFLQEIDKETACELSLFGFTSWGALMLSIKKVEWTEELIRALFDRIETNGWKNVRLILSQTKDKLP